MDSQPEVSENLKFLTGYARSRLRRFRPGNTESQVKRSGRRPGAGRPRTYRDRQGKPVHLRPVEKERRNRPAHAAYSESYFGQKKRDLRFNRDIN